MERAPVRFEIRAVMLRVHLREIAEQLAVMLRGVAAPGAHIVAGEGVRRPCSRRRGRGAAERTFAAGKRTRAAGQKQHGGEGGRARDGTGEFDHFFSRDLRKLRKSLLLPRSETTVQRPFRLRT